MKTCTTCKQTKAFSEFHKFIHSRDGYRPACIDCTKEYQAKYRRENAEKKKIAQDEWRAKNLEQQRIYKQKYYLENKEKVSERIDAWRKRNPEAYRRYKQNRRSKKLLKGGKLSYGLHIKLFELQKGKCACCKKPLGKNYHMDHIMPLALGGTNTDDNIQLLRAKCNLQKHTKHPIDFMRQRGFLL